MDWGEVGTLEAGIAGSLCYEAVNKKTQETLTGEVGERLIQEGKIEGLINNTKDV